MIDKTFEVQLEMTSSIQISAGTETEAISIARKLSQKELVAGFNGCQVYVCDAACEV